MEVIDDKHIILSKQPIPGSMWRVRVQVELGRNNDNNLLSSDHFDVPTKTDLFYKNI